MSTDTDIRFNWDDADYCDDGHRFCITSREKCELCEHGSEATYEPDLEPPGERLE